jgi:predicted RNA-binding protein
MANKIIKDTVWSGAKKGWNDRVKNVKDVINAVKAKNNMHGTLNNIVEGTVRREMKGTPYIRDIDEETLANEYAKSKNILEKDSIGGPKKIKEQWKKNKNRWFGENYK